ncbi:MAG: efflux RND transporter permease subunit [Acidobacteriota bacterium]|nr:efflux RND transporter permease subunit [Acidobacteriota bacterium]
MRLTDRSLANRVTVFFLAAATVFAGVNAYRSIPRESFPDIEIPLIIVFTIYPGAAPADVEEQVTYQLEQELKGLEGIKDLTSVSQEGSSVITAEFESGTDIDEALQKVRDRVDLAKPDLPGDAEDPVLQEINLSDIPIIQVNLSGDVGPVVLKELAEDLQDRLESLPGVLRVNLVGGLEREVRVDVDPEKLRLYGLSLDDVLDCVRDEHVSIPGGDIDLGTQTFAVRVPGEVDDPLAVGDFVIIARNGQPIFVRDVADVSFGFKDRSSFARINGEESVALSVQKRLGSNLIEVADSVKREVEAEKVHWPASVTTAILADQSKDIRIMVRDLENNILSGLTLVVLVLMFSLRLRNALFVGIAIPLSMLIAFLAIQLNGITLNMVVLFSLILAVGMLVDNAIVVIENIYRHMQEGTSPLRAASRATGEVGSAIAFSTLTTVAAFSPLFFWPDVIGDFMWYLPYTIVLTLSASLLVAFTLNPALAATFMRVKDSDRLAPGEDHSGGRNLQGKSGAFVVETYRRSLEWALDHRAVIVIGLLALFVAVLMLFATFNHGVEFFPETEPPQIFVDIETPSGTRIEETDALVRNVERRLAELPDVRVMAAGSGSGSQSEFFGGGSGSPTAGRIVLDLIDRMERSQSSFTTMAKARELVASVSGAVIEVDRPDEGPPVGDPVSVDLSGDDFAVLGDIARRIRLEIADIDGLVSLDDDFDLARPEILIRLDRTQAARLGLTTAKVAGTIRTAVNGTEAATFRQGDEDIDITVRLAEASRNSLEDLRRLTVVSEENGQIPISAIASVDRTKALTAIRHKDQKRVVTVSGKVTNPTLAEPVLQQVRSRLEAIPDLLPAGYTLTYAGQSEDEEEAKDFLSNAFLYGVIMVLGLMVAKFDSLALPAIVLTSVVMSMIGVLLGLLVTGLPFGIIMTGLGVISLAGIVVNNAIVLLDYGELLGAKGLARRERVMLTGIRRLRPVLLTAVTTILGLIPLSTGYEFDFHALHFSSGGESSQWWKGMGVAVIFGLAFATFLTLIVLPVLYDGLLQWREWRAKKKSGAPLDIEAVTEPSSDSELVA